MLYLRGMAHFNFVYPALLFIFCVIVWLSTRHLTGVVANGFDRLLYMFCMLSASFG